MSAKKKAKPNAKLVPHERMVLKKLGAKDARVQDRLGGAPNAWAEDEPWPVCGQCKEPLHFVVQLRGQRNGGHARIGGASWLQLFVCHNEADCEFYELRSNGHHVALRKKPLVAKLATRPGGNKSSVAADPLRFSYGITFKKGADDVAALDDYENDARFTAAHKRGFVDKLDGVPVAANEPDEVECTRCKKPMSFLGQLLSADDWFIYYLHTCKSGHEVTFHAQRA